LEQSEIAAVSGGTSQLFLVRELVWPISTKSVKAGFERVSSDIQTMLDQQIVNDLTTGS